MSASQKYQFRLAWLNSTGGWEYWNFLARRTYGYSISDKETIKNDIEQNWDATFINASAQYNVISVESRDRQTVRSQLLTVQQANAISKIKQSIRVIDLDAGVTVIVDGQSFDFRTDSKKLVELEFQITYPDNQIQQL